MLSLSYLLIGFTLLIAYLLYILVILPLIRLQPYRAKGNRVHFFPILGDFKENIQDFETKGDLLAGSREFSKKFPNQKYWFTNFSSQVMINLTDPEYVREFIQKQANYKKSSIVGLLSVLGTGLVFAEGEHWKRHRKIISNAFHYEFLKRNIHMIQNTTQEFLSKIGEKDYQDFPTIKKIQEITGEVVGRIFFKESLNTFTFRGKSLPLAIAEVLCDLAECANSPFVMIFGPKVMNIPFIPQYKKLMDKVKGIRQMCLEIIRNRKAHPKECDDLLGLLLATQNSEDAEQRFSDEDIINEFVTFVSAGMDTTGHLVALTLYNLTQHPELIASIKKEIEATYSVEKNVSADTLQKMDFLHTVLKETLRFYTPFPGFVPREAVKDHSLLDIEVKKGALLRFDFFSIFFNEKYYDNPYAFDPSRWTRGEPKMDSYAFLPFSAGARNCLGQHLAIMEAKVIVSEFLKRFEFKLKEGYKLKMLFRFTYEPFEDILLNLKPIS